MQCTMKSVTIQCSQPGLEPRLLEIEKKYTNGLDSTSVVNMFKNPTTIFSPRNMFRCFKHHHHHHQPSLAPVLANFFMGHYEKLWLDNYTGPKVLYYRRYVDDIICCFRNSEDAIMFLNISTCAIITSSSLWKQRKKVNCHF